eukprot:7357915-Prymnesium_polylepis.1
MSDHTMAAPLAAAAKRPARKRRAKNGSASKVSSAMLPGMSFLDADAELLKRCKRRFEEELKALREEESQLRTWLRAEDNAAPAFDVDAIAEVLDAQGEPTPQLGPTALPDVVGLSPFLSASSSPAGALGAEHGTGDRVLPAAAARGHTCRPVLPASCTGWVTMDAAAPPAVGPRADAGSVPGGAVIPNTSACGGGAVGACVEEGGAVTTAATDAAAPGTDAAAPGTDDDDDDDDSSDSDGGGRLAAYAAAAQREALESGVEQSLVAS